MFSDKKYYIYSGGELRHAKNLLNHTDRTIKTICLQLLHLCWLYKTKLLWEFDQTLSFPA